jgi:hypothetical protein
VDAVHRPEPVVGLAVFRVLAALVLAKVLLAIWWLGVDVELYRLPTDGGMTSLAPSWRLDWLGGPTPGVVTAVLWTGIGACGLLALGVVPNLAALVAAQAFLALNALHADAGGGHDKLIVNGLWLLALSPCGASLSLPAWWRGGGVGSHAAGLVAAQAPDVADLGGVHVRGHRQGGPGVVAVGAAGTRCTARCCSPTGTRSTPPGRRTCTR